MSRIPAQQLLGKSYTVCLVMESDSICYLDSLSHLKDKLHCAAQALATS